MTFDLENATSVIPVFSAIVMPWIMGALFDTMIGRVPAPPS